MYRVDRSLPVVIYPGSHITKYNLKPLTHVVSKSLQGAASSSWKAKQRIYVVSCNCNVLLATVYLQ